VPFASKIDGRRGRPRRRRRAAEAAVADASSIAVVGSGNLGLSTSPDTTID
jgi:hypothetical protein